MAQPPQEWFLNTPVLWFAGVILTLVLRGPLRSAPAFIRKILKFATVSLFALGFALLLLSSPVQKAAKHSAVLTAFWVVLSGLTPIAWIVLAFRAFSRRQTRALWPEVSLDHLPNLILCIIYAAEVYKTISALMSAIDQHRETGGLLLMAATNRLDGLDDALLREGRFDLKLRIDLPDEAERLRILEARLRKKPSSRFDLREFARLTPGASPAKLAALIDQAATYAFADNRKITSADLYRALNEAGGKDLPQLERVEWDQVVIDESVKQDIQSFIRLLENGAKTREMGLEVPSGLLLIGPPGTARA